MTHAPIVAPPAGWPRDCAARAAAAMKLLAHPARLGILLYLAQCEEASVGELETSVGIRQPTLSQQLALLRAGGAVVRVRRGRHAFYRLCDGAMARLVLGVRDADSAARRRTTTRPVRPVRAPTTGLRTSDAPQ